MTAYEYDAVVVGAGPNGLAAAIHLARSGRSVLVVEGDEKPGGGLRSAPLTAPGYIHDVCSAIHPLAVASPFLATLDWDALGVEWVEPPAALAHPFDDGEVALLTRDLDETAAALGRDGAAWARLFGPLVRSAEPLLDAILGPPRPTRHVGALARFGLTAVRSATGVARSRFATPEARALFGGIGAHSMLPLEASPSAGVAMMLGLLAHHAGWPFPRSGAQVVADALVAHVIALGGRVETGRWVRHVDELPRARVYLLDVGPRALTGLAYDRLPDRYHDKLLRFRYGPGVFKIDWALSGPVPWLASACSSAATVHLGGTIEEIAAAESSVARGRLADRPFVLFAQHTPFDPTRAPAGGHTAWAYCHVPHGYDDDMTDAIEEQVERFAPGFRDLVVARATRTSPEFEAYNPNIVGGDINGGLQDLRQHFARPVASLNPYRTPARGVYICSSSTPPGGGVHGMCGYHAARTAIHDMERGRV